MTMRFKCPICGNGSYSELLSEIFMCDNCSVHFSNPAKFSAASKENKQNKQTDTIVKKQVGQPVMAPSSVGMVVSTPIKLNRK